MAVLIASSHWTLNPRFSDKNLSGTKVLSFISLAGTSIVAALPFTVAVVLSIPKVTLLSWPPSALAGIVAVAVCVASSQVTVAPICSIRNRIGTKVRSFSVTGG